MENKTYIKSVGIGKQYAGKAALEDVDICVRAWKAGMKVVACPAVSVVHDARRESHRTFRFRYWHIASRARYFYKHWGRLPSVSDQP